MANYPYNYGGMQSPYQMNPYLQNQVNKLQLDQATAGMLRFPNSWSYGAGPFPPIFGGCPGNGYNNI